MDGSRVGCVSVQTAQLSEHLLRLPAQLAEADSASRAKRFAVYLWLDAAVQLVKPSRRHLRRRAPGLLGMHGSMYAARSPTQQFRLLLPMLTAPVASVLIRGLPVVRQCTKKRSQLL